MMDWLKRIFSSRSTPQSEPDQSQVVRFLDDQHYYSNSDVIEGMEFSATLQIRTPLSVLKHHGEVFNGPPSLAPAYGSQADGIWLPKTKFFRRFGIAEDEYESLHASDVGSIEPSRYLPFLIQFRTIVESNLTHEDKLAQLSSLPEQSTEFKEIWGKLSSNDEDFPMSFFYLQFAVLPGIGRALAKRLYESGFRSVDEIANASVSRLTAVPGLGEATALKIRAVHPSRMRSDL